MAIYSYNCEEHGLFDRLVKMSDSELPQPCPVCGNLSTREKFTADSTSSFHLKGNWFKTTKQY